MRRGAQLPMMEFPPFPVSLGPAVKTPPPPRIGEDSLFNVGPPGNPGRERSAHTGGVLLIHGEKECLFKHFFSFLLSSSDEDSLTSHRRPTFSMHMHRVCSLLSIYLDFLPSDFLNQALLPFLYIYLVQHICFNAAKLEFTSKKIGFHAGLSALWNSNFYNEDCFDNWWQCWNINRICKKIYQSQLHFFIRLRGKI